VYFMPRNNKAYAALAQMRSLHRYLLTFLLIGVLVYGGLHSVYVPLEQAIAWHQQEIAQLHEQYAQCNLAKQTCAHLTDTVDELRSSIAAYTHNKKTAQQHSLVSVLNYAQHAGLQLGAYSAGQHADHQWYSTDQTHFSFVGNTDQLMQFFNALIKSEYIMQCTKLALARTDERIGTITCDLSKVVIKDPST